MSFTVTWQCEGCERKFVGQADHLVDAVTAMATSVPADHSKPLGRELAALDKKAREVEVMGSVLEALGLEPGQVEIMQPITMEQFQAMMRGEKPDA